MVTKDTVHFVGDLMVLAARTAPKAVGQDFIEARVLDEEERIALGKDMVSLASERGAPNWARDGQNILDSMAVVLIGLVEHKGAGLDCGACGFSGCREFNERSMELQFKGPNCALRLLDLGIALGSAAKVAADHGVDNRIMYRIGVSARRLGLTSTYISHGIPLSATGKNIFFDRPMMT
jgi:uncharacterized ferredoxin-like protein